VLCFFVVRESWEATNDSLGYLQQWHPNPKWVTVRHYDGKEDPLPWLNRFSQFFQI
jgi:hypothetical protein